MREKYIKDLFIYYKQTVIFQDIFDLKISEREINQLALSMLSVELDLPKDKLQSLLKL